MNHRLIRVAVPLAAGAAMAVAAVAGTSAAVGAPTGPHASAASTTTTLVSAPPVQSRHKKPLFVSFNTVTGGGTPKPAGACTQTNDFVQGQIVVFRVWGVDVTTGGTPLTDKNVQKAFVTIPGKGAIALSYGKHGAVAFWSAPWNTTGYPVGTVNFTITFTAKPVPAKGAHAPIPAQTAVFSQAGFAPPSLLTVTAPVAGSTGAA